MSKSSEEERIRRLRDAQIAARDPGPSKIRHYDWSQHAKRQKAIQKSRRKPLLIALWSLLPGRWKGLIFGLLFGLIPLVGGLAFLTGDWQLIGVLGMLVCGVVGFVIGVVLNPDFTMPG